MQTYIYLHHCFIVNICNILLLLSIQNDLALNPSRVSFTLPYQNGWKQKKNRINTRQEKMRNEVEMITCSARYNQKKARLGVVCILYHLPNVCLSLSTFVKSVSWTWLNGILVVSPKQNEKHKNCSIEHGILLAGYVLFLEFCFYYSLR